MNRTRTFTFIKLILSTTLNHHLFYIFNKYFLFYCTLFFFYFKIIADKQIFTNVNISLRHYKFFFFGYTLQCCKKYIWRVSSKVQNHTTVCGITVTYYIFTYIYVVCKRCFICDLHNW
jgi:hypothetical protein